MRDVTRYSSLRDYVRVLRQRRLLIGVFAIAFAAVALAQSIRATPLYQAESSVALRDLAADLTLVGTSVLPQSVPSQQAESLAKDVRGIRLATRVKRDLRSPLSAQAIRGKVAANVELRTSDVVIQVTDPDRQQAAKLANAYAEAAVQQVTTDQRARFASALRSIEREGSGGEKRLDPSVRAATQAAKLATIERLRALSAFAQPASVQGTADVPDVPVSPRPVRNVVLGLLLGLTLGLVLAFVRDSLDRRLRTSSEIREELALPLVGTMSNDGLGSSGFKGDNVRALPETDLEAARILRTNLAHLDVDQPVHSVVVTSALPEEGKTSVALALALVNVLAGKRTLLVECDLRRPSLSDRLGVSRAPGLSDYLAGQATPAEILQLVDLPGDGSVVAALRAAPDAEQGPNVLVCISSGTIVPRATEALQSERFQAFLSEVCGVYDFVILDCPPVLPVADALALVPLADAVVLCVRAGQTTRDQAHALLTALEQVQGGPRAVVATGLSAEQDETYSYAPYSYDDVRKRA